MNRGGKAHGPDLTSPRFWIGRAGMSGHPVPSNIEHLTMPCRILSGSELLWRREYRAVRWERCAEGLRLALRAGAFGCDRQER